MPIVTVIEVIASSEIDIDDAIINSVSEVSKTVRNINSVYDKDIKVHKKDNEITSFDMVCN